MRKVWFFGRGEVVGLNCVSSVWGLEFRIDMGSGLKIFRGIFFYSFN